MKKYLLLLFVSLILASCSGKHEQQYDSYKSYQEAKLKDKSWFPSMLSSDAYNIKNVSSRDSSCAYGMFSYRKDSLYDSIFAVSSKNRIAYSIFNDKVEKHIRLKPGWFINPPVYVYSGFETIKIDRFYIVRDKQGKKVYFIYCN